MISIEEYIARRKKEDRINEFNTDERNENMRVCVNYVFEYFNNYLNITEAEEKTVLKDEKLDKYRQQLREYDQEVKVWLVGIYSELSTYKNPNDEGMVKLMKAAETMLVNWKVNPIPANKNRAIMRIDRLASQVLGR